MLATKDALDIPADVRRYIGEFLRPRGLQQDEWQKTKSRHPNFEYICNALGRTGGTLTKDEFIEVNISFYFEEKGIQPREEDIFSFFLLCVSTRISCEREDILDAGIVVRKDDGNYTFHDDILSLIGDLL